MYKITLDNCSEAQEAIRDILFMYVDMAESYGGFGHNIETGGFDALKYLNAEVDVPPQYAVPVNPDLLHAGAAISLLCHLYDAWCEFDAIDLPSNAFIKQAAQQGHFRYVEDIEQIVLSAFARNPVLDDPWFDKALRPIYTKYVADYFAHLAAMRHNS